MASSANTVKPTLLPIGLNAERLAVAALYLIGCLHWMEFFNNGKLEFTAYDWPKERLYLHVFRDALDRRVFPLHMELPPPYVKEFPQFANHGRAADIVHPSRLLAIPETILSPQVVSLRWLSDGRFILLHFLLLYSIGFVGCLWIRSRYGLTTIPFAILFLLFNFNGYITSHLAVGHVMWGGYFFLPFFAVNILSWLELPTSVRPGLILGAVLFAMLLQGSLHLVVWCWMFIALVMMANPTVWWTGAVAISVSGLLAAVRLVPAAVAYWGFPGLPFGGGYPTLMTLVEALLVVRPSGYLPPGHIYWWEYDAYVGLLGFGVLAYFGIFKRFQHDPALAPYRFAGLDIPLFVMSVLSIGQLFYPIYRLPLPLINSERVSSRFIVIPLVLLLTLSVVRMQRVLATTTLAGKSVIAVALGIVVMWWALSFHMSEWAVHRLEHTPGTVWHQLETAKLADEPDAIYVASLWIGALISLVGVAAWIYCYRRAKPPVASPNLSN